jgi:2-polyprenyl-3-methyl-5-hydroxy-6-metoxy-1,4-benzoquinol methylase
LSRKKQPGKWLCKTGLTYQEQKKLSGLTGGSFDVITLWHVLEHMHDLQSSLQQLKKPVKRKWKAADSSTELYFERCCCIQSVLGRL